MELSKRLQAVADLVSEGMSVADVGTDHGYIPIYLVKTGKCKKALAMDVNQGPLLRAKEHIAQHNLSEQIQTRLSDGVRAIKKGECDCVVIAGMGGALTIRILEDGKEVFQSLKEFVLQPQSELVKVRQYLCENGYQVITEDMVLEDGKFYPMMKVVSVDAQVLHAECPRASEQGEEACCVSESRKTMQCETLNRDTLQDVELRYGKLLLEQKHPILKKFLDKEVRTKEQILHTLNMQSGPHIEERKKEIKVELEGIKYALQNYYGCD